ncbi:MAG: ABC transporter permease [candidate division KSB1 bacterium]|nr:ABC transporter permease [candidate division KSB1 bacterium]
MRTIGHLIRKEFRQIRRDRPMLGIIFVVPLVQLLILANVFTTETKHVKLLMVDMDRSRASRELLRVFSNTDRFDIVGHLDDPTPVREEMQAWRAQAALVIPPHFERDLLRGQAPQLQLVLDGVDGNTAGVALGYAEGIFRHFLEALPAPAAAQTDLRGAPIRLEERMFYNPNLSSQQYMVPGLVVALLTIIPMLLTAMSFARERELGTLEQLLVTPIRKHELLLGKLVPYLVLSYIELSFVTTAAVLAFRIHVEGSLVLLAGLGLVYLFTTLGLGIFVSTIAESQQQAMFVAYFFAVFMLLMSGFFIPIPNMPELLKKLTYLDPMRYFMAIVRDIFQKGSPLRYLLRDAIPMAAFGLAIFGFSVAKFRKQIG